MQYNATVRTARMNVVKAAIEAGPGPGELRIRSAGNVVLVAVPLDDPVNVSGDILTLLADDSTANGSVAGTAANAIVVDSTGTVVVSGLTVGTSGANVNLVSLAIAVGQPVQINTATITHP